MMNLRLGYFSDFKGADTVLLEGTSDGIRRLCAQIKAFVASSETELPIHSLSAVSAKHPVLLFASRSATGEGLGFRWLCSQKELNSIEGKLSALVASESGHQYFELVGSPTQFIVSVGEYGGEWWKNHG
jgi:hypothetical protein